MELENYTVGGNEEHDGITINNLYIDDETMAKIVLKKMKLHKPLSSEYLENIDERLAIKLIRDIFWELDIGEFEDMKDLFERYYDDEVDEFVRDELIDQDLENESYIDELSI